MNNQPILPKDPAFYDQLVTNARRYQRVVWKVAEGDIAIHFGQTDGIKGMRNNYEFRATNGKRQTFLGSNHAEDAEPTYEDGNLTRAYAIPEVIAIWLKLRNSN